MTADPWTYAEPVAAQPSAESRGEADISARVPDGTEAELRRAPSDVDRARTRWRLDRQRNQRRISQALDDVCVRLYGAEHAARYGIRDRRRGA